MKKKTKVMLGFVLFLMFVAAVTIAFQSSKDAQGLAPVARPAPIAQSTPKLPAATAVVGSVAIVSTPTTPPQPKAAVAEASAGGDTFAPNAEVQADLKTAIPDVIRILEANNLRELVKTYTPPNEIPPGVTVDGMVRFFRLEPQTVQAMADDLEALQAVKDQTPVMDPGGDKAVFKLPQPVAGHKNVYFVKVEGYWYLDGLND